MKPVYLTTPIYYVNARPHIGHCYTTLLADVTARFHRLIAGIHNPHPAGPGPGTVPGVFLLTGTDEHADKVVTSAAAHGVTPLQWADRNAAEFERAFAFMGCAYDDFIRTTQSRHISKVLEYINRLKGSGDVFLGDYHGWWDPSQEEYLTETVAKEANFVSPVTGRPLVRRTEKNYFFRLSAYADRLERHIRENPAFILPESRRNEVLGRLRAGLQDVPITRAVTDDPASQWGIRMPGDEQHRIYVWIDALFNYLSAVDTPERRHLWPARVHLIAKDILWFHACIWPCMLMALGEPLPQTVYTHGYWVREGRKMSKSEGNAVEIDLLEAYAAMFSRDGLRWYLISQGPAGSTDADFAHGKFVEVYNADLANGLGNCASRVSNMIAKYFDGRVPEAAAAATPGDPDFASITRAAIGRLPGLLDGMDIPAALALGPALIREVDGYINATAPFKLAKQLDAPGSDAAAVKARLATILYNCAETVRIACVLMQPAIPDKAARLLSDWNCTPPADALLEEVGRFRGQYGLKPGGVITKGEALFMRADPAAAAPVAAAPQ